MGQEKASEFEFLKWYYENSEDYGSRDWAMREFTRDTKLALPDGYALYGKFAEEEE
jgi:hypothetical protein